MVNPYRRGLGLGGRGEPMPYTGGGSARPLEPYRGGGRAVQLEDDPYADPSRTGPTYGDDGAGESTYNRRREPRASYDEPDFTGDTGRSEFESDFDTVRDEDGVVGEEDYQALRRKWAGLGQGQQFDDWWRDNFQRSNGGTWVPRTGNNIGNGDWNSDEGNWWNTEEGRKMRGGR